MAIRDVWERLWRRKSSALALYGAYRAGLMALFELVKQNAAGATLDPQIETLLNANRNVWTDLYEAEQRMTPYLGDVRIDAEAKRRFLEAEHLGVKSAAELKQAYYASGATPESRRALFSILLDDLHFRYEKRRLDRRELAITTQRLNWIGFFLLLVIIVATGNLLRDGEQELAAFYHQFWIIYFGTLGAYFSRLLALADTSGAFDYDALVRDFAWSSIGRRLIAGALGALLLYCMIRGELLAGDLFPPATFEALMTDATLYGEGRDAVKMPVINADFAKLIVWSTIAGFSERLIPDQLGKAEKSTSA